MPNVPDTEMELLCTNPYHWGTRSPCCVIFLLALFSVLLGKLPLVSTIFLWKSVTFKMQMSRWLVCVLHFYADRQTDTAVVWYASSYLQLYPAAVLALSFPLLALQRQLTLSPKLGKHQWLEYTWGSKKCGFSDGLSLGKENWKIG